MTLYWMAKSKHFFPYFNMFVVQSQTLSRHVVNLSPQWSQTCFTLFSSLLATLQCLYAAYGWVQSHWSTVHSADSWLPGLRMAKCGWRQLSPFHHECTEGLHLSLPRSFETGWWETRRWQAQARFSSRLGLDMQGSVWTDLAGRDKERILLEN